MRKNLFIILALMLICVFAFSSCDYTAPPESGGDDQQSAEENNDNNNDAEENNSSSDTATKCHHTFGDWNIIKQTTCKEEGKRTRTCNKCAQIEEESIPKNETHTAVIDAAVPASCKDTGLTEGSHCSVCNKVLVAQTVAPKTDDHTPVTDAAVPASCKDTGLTEGSHCSVCNKVLVAQTVAPKTDDHTPVTDAAVPASCKDTGLTEGSHCSVCNKILVEQTTAPVLEHDMTSATCISPATCRRNCGYTEGTVSKHVIANGICTICEAKTISTVEELKNIALNGKYILVNDLSLDNVEWTPIGTNTKPFTGFFDGNGHTISNLKITAQHNYFGLFGYNTGLIQNLGITTISFSGYVRLTGSIYAGGLAGYNSGTIKNCYTSEVNIILTHYPDVSIASGYAGGLSGYNTGEILCCYSSGTQVSMTAMATISATYAYAGGLVGCNKTGTISDCYSTIKKVAGSYNGSNMNCASYVGGLVGSNNSGTLTNCYRDSSQKFNSTISSTGTYKPTNDEGTSVEATELNTIAFHTDILGWSTDNWILNEGSLPSLKKEARVSAE